MMVLFQAGKMPDSIEKDIFANPAVGQKFSNAGISTVGITAASFNANGMPTSGTVYGGITSRSGWQTTSGPLPLAEGNRWLYENYDGN